MSDTISRQAAIDALMAILDKPSHAEFLYTDEICGALNGLPSAQPEREKGEWILSGENTYTCSVCGKTIITNKDYIKEHKWCFRCGADMR